MIFFNSFLFGVMGEIERLALPALWLNEKLYLLLGLVIHRIPIISCCMSMIIILNGHLMTVRKYPCLLQLNILCIPSLRAIVFWFSLRYDNLPQIANSSELF